MSEKYNLAADEKAAAFIGKCYREAGYRIELTEVKGEDTRKSIEDRELRLCIDQVLRECSSHTRWFIRNEYLQPKEPKWYMDYCSRTTYYRLKKKCVKEFMDKTRSLK